MHSKLSGKAFLLKAQRLSTFTDVSDCMLKTEIEDLSAAPSSDTATTTAIARIMKIRVRACPRAGSYPAGGWNKDAFLQALTLASRTKVDDGQGQENVATILDYTDTASQSEGDLKGHKLHRIEEDRTLTLGYYHRALRLDHKLACTFSGYYCNVPFDARPGDEILLCAGAIFPLVARRIGGAKPLRFQLIGGCYVHGVMYGEAWDPEAAEDVWFD